MLGLGEVLYSWGVNHLGSINCPMTLLLTFILNWFFSEFNWLTWQVNHLEVGAIEQIIREDGQKERTKLHH
jgi:hypothetical protein